MKNKKSIIIIIITVALIAALAVAAVFAAKMLKKNPSGGDTTEPASTQTASAGDETEPAAPESTEASSEPVTTGETGDTEPANDSPYSDKIYNNPPEIIEEPDPKADHEHKWELTSTEGGTDHTKPVTETYTCSICGAVKHYYLPAEEHDFTDEVIEPTCTEAGYTLHKCSLCGYIFKDSAKDALGHDFGEWKEADGKQIRTCSRCGVEEEKTSDATDVASIIVGKIEAAAGKSVNVPVSVKNNPGFCALLLSIEYDDKYLKLDDVVASSALGGQMSFVDKVAWIAFSDFKDDGEILTLVFDVSASAPAGTEISVTVKYSSGDICNFDEEDVDFAVVSGSVTVK